LPNFYKSRRFIRFYFLKRFAGVSIFALNATLRTIAKTPTSPRSTSPYYFARTVYFNVRPDAANRCFLAIFSVLTRRSPPSKTRRPFSSF